MLKFSFLAAGIWLSIVTLAHSAETVGFRETELNKEGSRPLHVAIWYPTEDQANTVTVGENRVFYGIPAVKGASPDTGVHPLVVFSHGYGGSWRNLNWLANELVQRGYVVAAPDHPGTTTFNKNADQAAKLWERPRDLSRVIDELTANSQLAGKIDARRIAAIGHSLGGWTVTALAGARFDTSRFEKDCQIHTSPRACSLSEELGLGNHELEKEMGDPRVGAIVSLDLGLARGFSPESLASIHIPSLVISAGTDIGDMPAKLESGYLAEHLPKSSSTYVEIPDAIHFSFMQLCKPGAAKLIEEDTPGDGIVCKDGGIRDREEIHREITFLVTGFLAKALLGKP
ncbi:alpha/beta hydrolase family protein [Ochrobactrum soli]|uniref:Alpha/beta fold hydrolase n=1 Tax=Ochrobactrum soli TaxID=2448455 RepID=A0A849KMM3_9HYPH|nr:alpha/beta fold hydrolase [[Ochrobactrum] soli]NNU62941.1 alpha/beta fold hydrolase [[Ochrobactrum] soli]